MLSMMLHDRGYDWVRGYGLEGIVLLRVKVRIKGFHRGYGDI
jgi:hypothetical protein